jgi:hypothetical protein
LNGATDIIVEVSTTVPPSEEELRAALGEWRVFISSVIGGMEEERGAVVRSVESVGALPVYFENFGGRDDDAERAYLSEVARSDVLVGILGERYGKPLSSGYSATHAEYNEAEAQGLRSSMWVWAGDHDGRQNDFIAELSVFHTYGSYSSPDDLEAKVAARLRELGIEELSPWLKIGRCVFRARSIEVSGSDIQVIAQLRDGPVYAELARVFRDANIFRNAVQFTCNFDSAGAEPVEMTTTSTSARVHGVELRLRRSDRASTSGLRDVTVSDYSPEDLTELAVRGALFGESNPLGSMAFMAEIEDPLGPLRGLPVSEDVVGSIARLLVTEALVGDERAERVTAFRLGPPSRGSRRLSLAWMPPRRYVNQDPQERSIEGGVSL